MNEPGDRRPSIGLNGKELHVLAVN